jgi:hypothetical protein
MAGERAVAVSRIDGPSSERTIRAMRSLANRIVEAEPLIDCLLRREDSAATYARDLISVREEIDNRLH